MARLFASLAAAATAAVLWTLGYTLADRTRRGEAAMPVLESLLRRVDVVLQQLGSSGFWARLAEQIASEVMGTAASEPEDDADGAKEEDPADGPGSGPVDKD